MERCTLCGSDELSPVSPVDDHRVYHQCERCYLIFADPRFYLSPDAERLRYTLHSNSIAHKGYVAFLNRVIQPSLPLLNNEMRGLDYGCGPVPTLSRLLARHNLLCYDYDPLFGFQHAFADYDFIFATECFEHFHSPGEEFSKIDQLLKPRGYIGVMTDFWQTVDDFNRWWYKRDPTHVSFFHRETFAYLAEKFGYVERYTDGRRVIIMQKIGGDETVRT